MKKNEQKKWIKSRHRIIRNLAYPVLYTYSKLKYGITADKFKEQGDRAYLILFNHQTPFDQFFVGASFKGAVYFLSSEDIFSLGWVSSLIRWLVAPIPIKKQTTDVSAVMKCIRVAKEGGTIAIAPEGNRTYSGKTEHINPSIASLAKKLQLPIAIYRIEGGYGVQPRWSDCVRKGKMHSYVSRVIEPEEYQNMSNEELFSIIQKELMVNEGTQGGIFKSNKRAEYLERAIYVCPYCGLSKFKSTGNVIQCEKCNRKIVYGENKKLTGVGFSFKFEYVTEWYDYQNEYISLLDTTKYVEQPLYQDQAKMFNVIACKRKQLLCKKAKLLLYGDRVEINLNDKKTLNFAFSDIFAIAVLGRNKLNIYYDNKIYQFKGEKRFNALKYVNLYYRYTNIIKGDNDGKFLGL